MPARLHVRPRSRPHLGALCVMAAVLAGGGCKKRADSDAAGAATTTSTNAPPAADEVRIVDVTLGRRLGADKRPTDATDDFSRRDTIYASVRTRGTAPSATLSARWTYQDGQVVKEDSRTLAPSGEETTEFHIAKPSGWPKGKYTVAISLGGSTETRDFEVK